MTDISNKKVIAKLKSFLELHQMNDSEEESRGASQSNVSEELLEKIEKVYNALEIEKVLRKPVPPVVVDDKPETNSVNIDTSIAASSSKTPKKSKKHKRDEVSTPASSKERKKKKHRIE